VVILIVLYGAVAVPVYWLRDTSLASFRALMALYVVYAVITYILSVVLNIYIPHYMRIALQHGDNSQPASQNALSDETSTPGNEPKIPSVESNFGKNEPRVADPKESRKSGFHMSALGSVGTTAGGILGLILVIILAQTLPSADGQTAGLLITTVFGFITIAGSIVSYLGLPIIPSKQSNDYGGWWRELLAPFRDLFKRKNMFFLLLSFTIYTDTVFALNSVTSQLYFSEVLPDTLEYSLYSLAGNLFLIVCTVAFYFWQTWRPPFRLEYWLIIGYALVLIIPVWGCIGLADVNFGFKVLACRILTRMFTSSMLANVKFNRSIGGSSMCKVSYSIFQTP
jgi:hypothetical protein